MLCRENYNFDVVYFGIDYVIRYGRIFIVNDSNWNFLNSVIESLYGFD